MSLLHFMVHPRPVVVLMENTLPQGRTTEVCLYGIRTLECRYQTFEDTSHQSLVLIGVLVELVVRKWRR